MTIQKMLIVRNKVKFFVLTENSVIYAIAFRYRNRNRYVVVFLKDLVRYFVGLQEKPYDDYVISKAIKCAKIVKREFRNSNIDLRYIDSLLLWWSGRLLTVNSK